MINTTTHDEAATQLRRGLRRLSRLEGFPVAIGGIVAPGGHRLVLSELHGLRTELLRGVVINPGMGLGGRVLERMVPQSVSDYVGANTITHHFDRAVKADGLRSVFAVPVVVRRQIRAVAYGASRACSSFSERSMDAAMAIARETAHNIEIEEEVGRRLHQLRVEDGRQMPPNRDIIEVNSELVSIASPVTDPGLRTQLLTLSDRLVGCAVTENARKSGIYLSQREADVLAQLAAGLTNVEIAERLAVMPSTVKTHLKGIMRKLDTHNRVETIAAARAAGLLP